MSVSYYLVCMHCKSGVLLGKTIPVEYYGNDCFGFSQMFEADDLRDLQQFLVAHRLHELRVLPGNAEKFASGIGLPHSFPGSDEDGLKERELLAEMTRDPANPDLDIEQIDGLVIEKLKGF